MFHSHDKVLEALTICHENALLKQQHVYSEEQLMYAVLPVGPTRFDPIIEGLRTGESHAQLRVACLQLVNVLVCTPDELDFRMHLRNEIMRAGLTHIFEVSCCFLVECQQKSLFLLHLQKSKFNRRINLILVEFCLAIKLMSIDFLDNESYRHNNNYL